MYLTAALDGTPLVLLLFFLIFIGVIGSLRWAFWMTKQEEARAKRENKRVSKKR